MKKKNGENLRQRQIQMTQYWSKYPNIPFRKLCYDHHDYAFIRLHQLQL